MVMLLRCRGQLAGVDSGKSRNVSLASLVAHAMLGLPSPGIAWVALPRPMGAHHCCAGGRLEVFETSSRGNFGGSCLYCIGREEIVHLLKRTTAGKNGFEVRRAPFPLQQAMKLSIATETLSLSCCDTTWVHFSWQLRYPWSED